MQSFRFAPFLCISILICVVSLGMAGGGCPNPGFAGAAVNAPNSSLEGTWSLVRGNVSVTCSWTVNNGGEHTETSSTDQLEPVPSTALPDVLKSSVDQWNSGLPELNAKLDKAFPGEIWVSFPQYGVMRIVDASDDSHFAEGGINSAGEYIFIGDLSGEGSGDNEGGGAVFQASSIQGKFDTLTATTSGRLARTLSILIGSVGGNNGGFTAHVSVDYTGHRIGDLPAGASGAGGG